MLVGLKGLVDLTPYSKVALNQISLTTRLNGHCNLPSLCNLLHSLFLTEKTLCEIHLYPIGVRQPVSLR